MDSFAVSVKSSDVWGRSRLVEEMQTDYYRMPQIPVIIDGYVWYFDDIGGGYDEGAHLVEFSFEYESGYTQPSLPHGDCFEAHLRNKSYTLWTEAMDWWESENSTHMVVKVDEYRSQEHTFWRELINGEYK